MIYQVDFSATSSGKVVSMTKRRIRWRWGFANQKALDKGKEGVECRGSEHEVTLVWSIASGKKVVSEDGKEIHFGVGRRAEGKFEHSWTGCNNHVYTIVAHASPPLKPKPGMKQFDLFIDGRSFNSFPRIFELRKRVFSANHHSPFISSSVRVPAPVVPRSEYRSDRNSIRYEREEEMQWAQQKTRVGYENRRRTMTVSTTQLPVPVSPLEEAEPQDLLSSPTESLMDLEYASSPSPTSASFGDSGSTAYSEQSGYNPSQPPTYEAVWSSIMDAYNTGDTENISPENAQTSMPDMSNLHIDTSHPTMFASNEKALSMESPKDVCNFDSVLNNLVNLDDISSSVLKGYTKKTFEESQNQDRTKSLAQLKSMQSRSRSGPTKEVMKTHQVYAENHPGAMVVYGQPQQSYNSYTYNAPLFYGSV